MEFYKEYIDDRLTSACVQLNADVKNNEQWRSEVVGYASLDGCSSILVRWIGLSSRSFKGDKE